MAIKINKFNVFLISALLSFCVLFIIVAINSTIFLDPIADEIVKERFDSGQIQLDSPDQPPIDIQWPLKSVVFFVFALSIYWFCYGRVIKKIIPTYPVALTFLLPILFSAFIQEFYFIPVYVLACYLGLKSVRRKSVME
jgi:hypothetical protein